MFLIIFGGIDLPDGVLEFFTRQNHVPAAAFADDADVAADAENFEAEGTAGMLFFQFQYVADQYFRNVHETLPFKIITFYYNMENRFCKPFPGSTQKIGQRTWEKLFEESFSHVFLISCFLFVRKGFGKGAGNLFP